jgi:protein-L-isoaspartate(D-aspartate) O-methyltransferase
MKRVHSVSLPYLMDSVYFKQGERNPSKSLLFTSQSNYGRKAMPLTMNPVKVDERGWARERLAMVAVLKAYGIRDRRVLAAMGHVRRHVFIPDAYRDHGSAYGDHAGPIGLGQTISQPFIVAYMIERLELKPGDSVLEIGTGSGYQAAVLAELGARVFTVELLPELARHARVALDGEGYEGRVEIMTGDGARGWAEKAPFDAIVGACAAAEEPDALLEQLKEGGRLIFPIGGRMEQRLVFMRKSQGLIVREEDLPVAFVPLITETHR